MMNFENYILTKFIQRQKIINAPLKRFVGSDEVWRRAMDSQRQFWEKSRQREDEFVLTRGAYRTLFNAAAAIAAAEAAMISAP